MYGLGVTPETWRNENNPIQVLQTIVGFSFKWIWDTLDIYDSTGIWIPPFVAMVTNTMYKLNFIGMSKIPSHITEKIRSVLYDAGKEVMKCEEDGNDYTTEVENEQRKGDNTQNDGEGLYLCL